MFVTSISISYLFLGVFIISLGFSLYFKILVINTKPGNLRREKIIGSMKDPITWRKKNNYMSYLSIFWSAISLGLFIYFKYFYKAGLVNLIYIFIYIGIVTISILFLGKVHKNKSKY